MKEHSCKEMDTSRPLTLCATVGCDSTVLTSGNHCLKHNTRMLYPPISSIASDGASVNRSLSQNAHHASRENLGAGRTSMDPRQTVRNSRFPPDMLNKHAITARKTIGGSAIQRSHLKSASPSSLTSSAYLGQGQTTARSFSQTSGSPDQMAASPSLQKGPLVNGEGKRKAAKTSSGASQSPLSSARAVSQISRHDFSQQSSSKQHGINNSSRISSAPRPNMNHQRSDSRGQAKTSTPSTASPGARDFRSMPVVKTNLRPPTSIKTAPPVPPQASTTHANRKRGRSVGSTSTSSSADEIDEEDSPISMSATNGPATSQHAGPSLQSRGAAATSFMAGFDKGPQTTVTRNGVADNNVDSHLPNFHSFIPDPSGPLTFAPHNPFLIASRDASVRGTESDQARTVLPTIENHDVHTSSASSRTTQGQRLFLETDAQWRTRPPIPKKKSCEQRRLELCAEFDEPRFDAIIYGQREATRPPEKVFIPAVATSALAAGQPRKPFYMRIDPRIHWSHNRSEEWYKRKMEEIAARGGRKANFGRAAQRLREQRLAEERRAVEEEAERATAAKQGRESPPPYNPPEPRSHRRPMDFGDVPKHELPSYVRENKEWLRATASMRDNRRRTLQANVLQAVGEPWEHLFAKDKNGRYILHLQGEESGAQ